MSGGVSEWGWMLVAGGAIGLFLLASVLSAVLVAASSLSRIALHRLGSGPGSRLDFVETLREPASVHRIAIQLAKNLCLVGGALLLVVAVRDASWSFWGTLGLGLAVVIGLSLLELVVARLLGLWNPRQALRVTAVLIRAVRIVLFPIAQPVHLLSVKIGGFQASTDESPDDVQNDEVDALIEVGERDGILEADEGQMMRSIVDLDHTAVREIMTPRPDIVALPVETNVEQARSVFLRSGQSRLPVFRGSLDEVVGVLHVRDLLRATDGPSATHSIEKYMRDPMFVQETLSVADLLSEMRLKTHMALVVDEYGGTAGLVTLEDLLEEIVGEIRDEHEPGQTLLRRESDGSWIINAAVHVDKLMELFDVEFAHPDFDTIGGLILSELGHVPKQGETLQFRSLFIEVLDADRRRIRLVRIGRHPRSETAQAGS